MNSVSATEVSDTPFNETTAQFSQVGPYFFFQFLFIF